MTTFAAVAFAASLAVPILAFADVAKDKFSAGMALVEQQNYPAALAALEESYRLAPKPKVLFNIGMCDRALFKFVDAIAAFEKFVAEGGDPKNPALTTEAKAQLLELAGLVGNLELSGAPDGAEVSIDAVRVATAPIENPLTVDPGKHIVSVARDGYEPFSIEVSVTSGATIHIAAAMKAAPRLEPMETVSVPSTTHFSSRSEPEPKSFPTLPSTMQPVTRDEGRGLRAAGWTIAALGVAATGVGIGFTVAYNNDVADGEDANDAYEISGSAADKAAYDDIKNNELPSDKAGLIVGYTVGGAMIVTGIVLLAAGYAKERRARGVAVAPAATGVRVSF